MSRHATGHTGHQHRLDPTGAGNATAASILTVLGAILITLAVTGRVQRYVQPAFSPWVCVAGAFLVGLGGWSLTVVARQQRAAQRAARRGGSGVLDAASPMRATSWLLLVPVALVLLSLPEPLGSAMLGAQSVGGTLAHQGAGQAARLHRAGGDPSARAAFPPLPAEEAAGTGVEISLEELADRLNFGDAQELDGVRVRLVGFSAAGEGRLDQLYRYKIYCCAADALAYSARLVGAPVEAREDQWWEVTGTVDVGASISGVPAVVVEQAVAVPRPERPYL
ncbi:TIGR03943 family putative permease subunit [Corynebacterium uberis]|uniref:TIGR03943 family putative permease subunit n=1 Tax=Corynebacterium uberis TaxID=2883169 RepID=UPI001D0A0581|nr:TIGR03943 family protein [Corynebacterium uberis]UDL77580.1 TIGR03943 family protein [Corynebacterium uberis]